MPIPMKKDAKGNAKPVFSGTEEASSSENRMVLCGWCQKEIPADSEACPFCKRDPRQPGVMADLLARAEEINKARKDEESERENSSNKKPSNDLFGSLSWLMAPRRKK
jgi:hypothetical protein